MQYSEAVKIIQGYLQAKPVQKAYLFGSYARGDSKTKSDIDLLVELDKNHQMGLEFIQMKLDLEKLLHHKVDLLTTNSISKYIYPAVEREKKLIYERRAR